MIDFIRKDWLRTKLRFAARIKFYREFFRYLREGCGIMEAIDSAWNVL